MGWIDRSGRIKSGDHEPFIFPGFDHTTIPRVSTLALWSWLTPPDWCQAGEAGSCAARGTPAKYRTTSNSSVNQVHEDNSFYLQIWRLFMAGEVLKNAHCLISQSSL